MVREFYASQGIGALPFPIDRLLFTQYLASKYPKGGASPVTGSAEKHLYSNNNFFLLGRALAAVTGLTYEDAVKELLFAPLGIPSAEMGGPTAASGLPSKQLDSEAFYYDNIPTCAPSEVDPSEALATKPYAPNFEFVVGAGSWRMSVIHLARFLAGIQLRLILDDETTTEMWTPPDVSTYARGWDTVYWKFIVGTGSYLSRAGHGGKLHGVASRIVHWTDGVSVACLASDRSGGAVLPSVPAIRLAIDSVSDPTWNSPSYDLFPGFGLPSLS